MSLLPAAIGSLPQATGALALDTDALTMRFASLTALDAVSIKVAPASVHALLGESTLVKCVAGFQRPGAGSILVDGREQSIANPVVASRLGIGMVYQHFTLAPGMTEAENLLAGRPHRRDERRAAGLRSAGSQRRTPCAGRPHGWRPSR